MTGMFAGNILVPAFVSSATALAVAVITIFFAKKREREVDWRKLTPERK